MKALAGLMGGPIAALVLLLVAVPGRAATEHDRGITTWRSPTGNIRCQIDRRPRGGSATCRTLRPGRALRVVRGGRVSRRSPSVISPRPEPKRALRYGQSARARGIRCTSFIRGMRCVDIRSGRGFCIAREFARLRPDCGAPVSSGGGGGGPGGGGGGGAGGGGGGGGGGSPTPGNIYNCGDFPLADGTTAQDYLDRYPSDPSGLDGNRDGVACE